MINVLLVEDDEGDAFLFKEALEQTRFKTHLHCCRDGVEALEFLNDNNQPRPDLILLDLNMPKMGGHEVLSHIKNDDLIKDIPVGILTTSTDGDDIKTSYQNHANCYIAKPTSFDELQNVVNSLNEFWMQIVRLPNSA